MNIPNTLSIIRIGLIPFFLSVYINAQDRAMFLLSGIILLISGLTDLLDGYIARKYNMITQLGKVLDPLADKLTQAAVCLAMAVRMPQMVYLLILFVLKELTMLCAGVFLIRKKIIITASKWFGKLYTFVFYAIMLLIISLPVTNPVVVFWMLAAVACFMLFSFAMYIPIFFNLKNHGKRGENLKNIE